MAAQWQFFYCIILLSQLLLLPHICS